jgi:hypothetical protein
VVKQQSGRCNIAIQVWREGGRFTVAVTGEHGENRSVLVGRKAAS